MQQTEKYQFNLIEGSDTFSAQPLNDNMAKVEAALTAHRAEVSAALSAQAAEVEAAETAADAAVAAHRSEVNTALANHRTEVNTALANHRTEVNAALSAQAVKVTALPRIVTGSYTGTGEHGADHPTVLEFPDAERPPALILISEPDNNIQATMIRGTTHCLVLWETYTKDFVYLTWTNKGVRWYSNNHSGVQLNGANTVYSYVAFI